MPKDTVVVVLADVPENSEQAFVDDVVLDKGMPEEVTKEQAARLKAAVPQLDTPAEVFAREEDPQGDVKPPVEKATT